MIEVPRDDVLGALHDQSALLVDYALEVFLEYDFNEHGILGGTLTGGHVATYLAREADRMADELLEATGQPVPKPDRGRRWELTENGNLRPGAVLVDDIQVSTERLQRVLEPVADWSVLAPPVRALPARRLVQLVVHLADLGRGWEELSHDDAAVAASALPEVLADELAGYSLTITDAGQGLGWTRTRDAISVTGPPTLLLAWASGRTGGVAGIPTGLPTPTRRVWI